MATREGTPEQRTFGQLLRQFRESAGLSQERLAERAGLSAPTVSNLERGVNRPRLETVTLLAEALSATEEQRAALIAAALPERMPAHAAAPPAVPAITPRHNLPVPPTALLGREQEVVALQARLRDPPVRLLTLTGVGGVGKTRLALAVAQGMLEAFPGGVWLVSLAALADPALLPNAVAATVGLREEPQRPVLATLTEHLKDRRLLLLLDNCEHLLDTCAGLASTLLRMCPDLRVLATSREGLRVSGEHLYQVPALSVPDSQHALSPEAMSSFEAVRLFVTRAQAQRPDFALTDHNASAIATVCARLDGLPLAIELAAARVHSLTVDAIATRLDERFRLLTGGPRDVSPRQQTLRATMDWSWELLEEPERALLCRLAVFAGGWTLPAAEVLGGGDGAADGAVLDVLDGLVHKALVGLDETGAEIRYTLLETVRAYAAERLADAGAAATVRDQHLAWYLALAEEAAPLLLGAEQEAWLARLERDHDNLRAALAWAHERGAGELGLRLAVALCWFWLMGGYLSEGRGWIEQALAVAEAAPAALRAAALNGAGNLAVDQGEYAQAGTLYAAALALRRDLGDKRSIAASLNNLAVTVDRQGDYERAAMLFEEALALARELEDMTLIAKTLGNLGTVLGHQGELEREAALYEEALALFRTLDDRHNIAVALDNLGLLALRRGEDERAWALHEEALRLFRTLGDQHGIAGSLNNLGAVAARQGDDARALALSGESLRLSRAIGATEQAIEGLEVVALVVQARGQQRRAAQLSGAAASLREALGVPARPDQRAAQALARQDMHLALGEDDFARAWDEGHGLPLEDAITLALQSHATTQSESITPTAPLRPPAARPPSSA